MSEELRACPFCGKTIEIRVDVDGDFFLFHYSKDCPIQTAPFRRALIWTVKAEFIKAINTRPFEDSLLIQRNQLLDKLEWIIHLLHGISKGGGKPTDEEWKDAIDSSIVLIANVKGG